MKQNNRIFRDIVYVASSNLYRHILGFITALFRPTLLGPELYGLWSLVNILPNFTTFAHLGSRTAMRFKIPQYHTSQAVEVHKIQSNAFVTAIICNLLIAFFVGGYALFFVDDKLKSDAWLIISIVVIANCLYEHFVSVLKGEQNFVIVSKLTFIRYSLNFVLTGLFIYFWGLYGALLALLLSIIITLIYLVYKDHFNVTLQFDFRTALDLIKIGAPIVTLDLIYLSIKNIDKMMIAMFMGTQLLGFYAISSMFIGPLLNIPGATREVTEQALMSEHTTLSKQQQLNQYLFKPLRYLAYLMPLLIACIYFSLPAFITLFLPKYAQSELPTQLLICGAYFLALSYPCRGLFVANNWQGHASKLASLSILINISLLALCIINNYSLAGIAISASITYFSLFIILLTALIKQFGVNPVVYIWQYLALLVPFTIMILLFFFIEFIELPEHPIVKSLLSLLYFFVGYSPFLYFENKKEPFLAGNKKDKNE